VYGLSARHFEILSFLWLFFQKQVNAMFHDRLSFRMPELTGIKEVVHGHGKALA